MFKQFFRDLSLVLLGFAAAISIRASLADKPILDGKTTLDLGGGECRYTRAPNGTWRQDEFQNSFRTADNCQSFGFSFAPIKDWTFGLHYVSLGSVSLDAIAVTCPKDDCDHTRDPSKDFYRADCKPHFNEDNCAYRWVSGGNAKGALATTSYRIFDMGALGFDLRGGLFFHQLKYAAVVEDVGCPDGCRMATITQRTHFAIRPTYGIGAKYAPEFLKGGFVGVTWDRFVGLGDRVKDMTAGFKGDTDRIMFWAGVPL